LFAVLFAVLFAIGCNGLPVVCVLTGFILLLDILYNKTIYGLFRGIFWRQKIFYKKIKIFQKVVKIV
jgi:hypothetical protein